MKRLRWFGQFYLVTVLIWNIGILRTYGKVSVEKSAVHVIEDAWYTMQTGSTPWGYYHEIIEERDGKYIYRYDMTKRERNTTYTENLGAIAKHDLTPVTFNLSKSGQSATEVINGSYVEEKGGPIFKVETDGARRASSKHHVKKGVILESFFPLWVSQNWQAIKNLRKGKKLTVSLLSEDVAQGAFSVKKAQTEIIDQDLDRKCTIFRVMFENTPYLWCITKEGVSVDMVVGHNQIHVQKVRNEQEAKKFLK